MTEQQKERAEVKKELQEIVTAIRTQLHKKEFPKAVFTAAGLKKADMEGRVHCGSGTTDSIANAELVRQNKTFIEFIKRTGAKVKFEQVKTSVESGRKDGKKKTQCRTQLKLIWTQEAQEATEAPETAEEPGEE